MQSRPCQQGRKLLDAIINSNVKEHEEAAMRLLGQVASAEVTNMNPDIVSMADLHIKLIDDTHDDMTALMTAVRAGNVRIVKCIIDLITFYHQKHHPEKFDFDVTDKNGNTALMHAASCGNLELVKILLATRACDPTIKNLHWQSAVSLAAMGNHHEVEQHLIDICKEIEIHRAGKIIAIQSLINSAVGDMKMIQDKEPEFKKPKSKSRK